MNHAGRFFTRLFKFVSGLYAVKEDEASCETKKYQCLLGRKECLGSRARPECKIRYICEMSCAERPLWHIPLLLSSLLDEDHGAIV